MITFSREDASVFLHSKTGAEIDGFEVVLDEQVDQRRWVSEHELIIKNLHSGTFYHTFYLRGLTECQDVPAWQDQEEVTFTRVKRVPVEHFIYEDDE
jgi:hypothetical protein